MISVGLITPSRSPFASLVLLIINKYGSWRFCIDYRKVNNITVKSKLPMLIADELMDELSGMTCIFQFGPEGRVP